MKLFTYGPKYSLSYIQAEKLFPEVEITPENNIQNLLKKISRNKSSLAIINIGNNINGLNTQIVEKINQNNLKIWDIYQTKPDLNLYAHSNLIKDIYIPQDYSLVVQESLNQKYAQINHEITHDLKSAVEACMYQPNGALICNPKLASFLKLKAVDKYILDQGNPIIDFAIISQNQNAQVHTRTHIKLTPKKNLENGLINLLYPFKEHQVGISQIHTIPNRDSASQNHFLLEIKGDPRQAKLRQTITMLERDLKICNVQILGGQTDTLKNTLESKD